MGLKVRTIAKNNNLQIPNEKCNLSKVNNKTQYENNDVKGMSVTFGIYHLEDIILSLDSIISIDDSIISSTMINGALIQGIRKKKVLEPLAVTL